jgi:hypothetical protein
MRELDICGSLGSETLIVGCGELRQRENPRLRYGKASLRHEVYERRALGDRHISSEATTKRIFRGMAENN